MKKLKEGLSTNEKEGLTYAIYVCATKLICVCLINTDEINICR